jgi:mRNA interferase RelE/StbE
MSYASFRIEVDPKADRELKKLHRTHPAIVDKLIRLIDGLLADPFQGKPLKGAKQGCYSLRYRDYRIIYEVYAKERVIHLIRVGDRRDIYR